MSDEVFKKPFSVTLTRPYIECLNHLVEEGIYMEHQEAMREALRRLFQFYGLEPFTDKGAELEPENDPRARAII